MGSWWRKLTFLTFRLRDEKDGESDVSAPLLDSDQNTEQGNLESVLPSLLDPRDTQILQLLSCRFVRFLDAGRHLGQFVDESAESGKNDENDHFLPLSDIMAPS